MGKRKEKIAVPFSTQNLRDKFSKISLLSQKALFRKKKLVSFLIFKKLLKSLVFDISDSKKAHHWQQNFTYRPLLYRCCFASVSPCFGSKHAMTVRVHGLRNHFLQASWKLQIKLTADDSIWMSFWSL